MTRKFAILAAVLFAACSSNNNDATGPASRACTKGTLGAPGTGSGTLNSTSCVRYDLQYTDTMVPYDAWDVTLVKGQGYRFDLRSDSPATKNFDGVLQLMATDTDLGGERLLTISDDEGGQNFAEFYFIAPVSGTYSLITQAYSFADTSRYVVTAGVCNSPLPQIVDSLPPTAQTIAAVDCQITQPDNIQDSVHAKLYSLHFEPNETKTISVTSTDFSANYQMYGPGWNTPCYYEFQGCGALYGTNTGPSLVVATFDANGAYGNNPFANNFLGWYDFPGDYTLAVYGTTFADVGSFTLHVEEGATAVAIADKYGVPLLEPGLHHLTRKPARRMR